ncbi:MAG: hypothetical protein AAGA30_10295 [Planctomycetota bacterium]
MVDSTGQPDIGVLENLPEEIRFLAASAMRFRVDAVDEITETDRLELERIAKRMREGNFFKLIDEFLEEYHMTKYEECKRLVSLFHLLDRLKLVYQNYLLSFVTDDSGRMVSIHMDLNGADRLIETLRELRDSMLENVCPHDHLFCDDGLTMTMLATQPHEKNTVGHVKIYGWNDEWAVKHRLRPQ